MVFNLPRGKPAGKAGADYSRWRLFAKKTLSAKAAPAAPWPRVKRSRPSADPEAAFYASEPWTALLGAAARTAESDDYLRHLRQTEREVLEVLRATVSHSKTNILRAATSKYIFGQQDLGSTARMGSSSSAVAQLDTPTPPACHDARVSGFLHAVARLASDSEHDRVACLRLASTWILKVVYKMRWPLSCFFTAVHGVEQSSRKGMTRFDAHVFNRNATVLSLACLLVAIACECSHTELMRAKVIMCRVPVVPSMHDVVSKQLSVVAGLNNGSLLLKTPVDWLTYYTARLQLKNEEITDVLAAAGVEIDLYAALYEHVDTVHDCTSLSTEMVAYVTNCEAGLVPPPVLMSSIWEIVLHCSVWMYLNSLHRKVESATFVAALMWHLIMVEYLPQLLPLSRQSTTVEDEAGAAPPPAGSGGRLPTACLERLALLMFCIDLDELRPWADAADRIMAAAERAGATAAADLAD